MHADLVDRPGFVWQTLNSEWFQQEQGADFGGHLKQKESLVHVVSDLGGPLAGPQPLPRFG